MDLQQGIFPLSFFLSFILPISRLLTFKSCILRIILVMISCFLNIAEMEISKFTIKDFKGQKFVSLKNESSLELPSSVIQGKLTH